MATKLCRLPPTPSTSGRVECNFSLICYFNLCRLQETLLSGGERTLEGFAKYLQNNCKSCLTFLPLQLQHMFNTQKTSHRFSQMNVWGPMENFLPMFFVNGMCDASLAFAECCFDGGECGCPTCTNSRFSYKVNDGICDPVLNTAQCCFDGGDCDVVSRECMQCPPTFMKILQANPGQCVPALNLPLCCYSLGNCGEFDPEDQCLSSGTRVPLFILLNEPEAIPDDKAFVQTGCPLELQFRLGDGICDPDIGALEDRCCYDGGDCFYPVEMLCPSCPHHQYAMKALKHGLCMAELNNEECCYSMGNCDRDYS